MNYIVLLKMCALSSLRLIEVDSTHVREYLKQYIKLHILRKVIKGT